jgi:uncharacterized membrane protein
LVKNILFLALATIAVPSYGYIDPGTGSLVIQSIIGAIAAIGVTLKLYWHKLKLMFSKRQSASDSDVNEDKSESNV